MGRTANEFSGIRLRRFLRRFFRSQPELDRRQADQLARASARAVLSLRVRRPLALSARKQSTSGGETAHASGQPAGRRADERFARVASALSDAARQASGQRQEAPLESLQESPAFDPYAFGLVPTFQRHGAEGLMAQLETVANVADLRKLARAQQIVLPIELRAGEAEADAVRQGIVSAVAKRVADRRAAAG